MMTRLYLGKAERSACFQVGEAPDCFHQKDAMNLVTVVLEGAVLDVSRFSRHYDLLVRFSGTSVFPQPLDIPNANPISGWCSYTQAKCQPYHEPEDSGRILI
jgi:hypothetical protein